jgi:ribosomal protein S18 acetylase RimI-like enzyme
MADDITLGAAAAESASEIAEIHLAARREAMPHLHRPHSDEAVRNWFGGAVGQPPGTWWAARQGSRIVGYMLLQEEHLDHLYVLPGWQRRGIGSLLLAHAKQLSPRRLQLYAFQRNTAAREFYEAHGFRAVALRDGSDNPEQEPDVAYEWRGAAR